MMISFALVAKNVPVNFFSYLMLLTIPLICLGRLKQIIMTFYSKSSGTLSLISFGLFSLGNAARVFTTLVEAKGNIILVFPHISVFLMNFIITMQILYYGEAKAKSDSVENPKKKEL